MSIENAIAGLAVKNLNSAVAWYTNLLGKPPDSRPMDELAEWTFARGGWLQVFVSAENAGGGSCTLAVSSVDEQVTRLAALGITGKRTSSPKVKTVMITDPDGNHLAFAEALDPTIAR